MLSGNLFNELSPWSRVLTAIVPFLVATLVRLLLGNNPLSRWLLSLSVLWFTANVLMAPYTAGMRQNIRDLL